MKQKKFLARTKQADKTKQEKEFLRAYRNPYIA